MKIESVESFVVHGAHYVRITTDTGITGVGQSAVWGYPGAVDQVVGRLQHVMVGQDPFRIEHIGQALYRHRPFRGAILSGAISAVDIALWDIKGKAFGVPAVELLGGRCRDKIRVHLLLDTGPGATIEAVVAAAVEGTKAGFTAIKFDLFWGHYVDLSQSALIGRAERLVGAVREAVGEDVDLIIEMHRALTPLQAVPVIEALEKFRIWFFEDPIQIDSIQAQARIATRTTQPMGMGERMFSIWEFSELLERGGPQYVRPDVGTAGGLTHSKKIAAIAEAHHATVVPHNFLGLVLTAATATLLASIPNAGTLEYLASEDGPTAGVETAYVRDGGYLMVPDAPGLGVHLDEAKLQPGLLANMEQFYNVHLRADGSVASAV
jgi:galactonate dehydratase